MQAFYSCNKKPGTIKYTERRMLMVPDSPYTISAVINDPDDPARLVGIDFTIGDDTLPIKELSVKASSSNTNVVPDTNLIVSGSGASRNLKIKPIAAGYSTITVTVVINGSRHFTYVLNYAASKGVTAGGKRWHTGIADASAAIGIDDEYMIVANDETNYLYLYNLNRSGLPLKSFDFNQGNILGLTDSSAGIWRAVDVEGAVISTSNPSLINWIGSMSNNSISDDRPNRNRLFAITVSGKAATSSFANAGYYSHLREKLISWGNAQDYDFSTSAAAGKNPKQGDGFNIEGMVFGPDNRTMYIGFRAPLVPTANRTKALIAPIQNFESWFNNGLPAGNPTLGSPIELDLGGRGIRDMILLGNGNYVIIAGNCDHEIRSAVYTWTGHATDAPAKKKFV